MKKVYGYQIEKLPFEELERVSDLIQFEGPILSHYKDKFNNHYLFYWVDQDAQLNRWVIWNVKEDFIYLYVDKQITLETTFPKGGEVIYVVDIDNQINIKQVVLTYPSFLEERYKPEIDSYFSFAVPEVYEEKIQVKEYLSEMQEKALYFNIEPTTDRYKITVGLEDVSQALDSVQKSFAEYVQYNVKNILGKRLTDKNRIITAAKALASSNRLRVVYLNLNSFHVGIAADVVNLNENTMDPSIDSFKHEAMINFRNEVLDNDFSAKEDVDAIIQKFPDGETRRKIFDPIIKMINNDNIKVNVNDYSKEFDKTYKRISKSERNIIIPPKATVLEKDDQPDQTVMVAYYIADKEAENTLFPKDINKRLLYTKEVGERFPFELSKLTLLNGEEINFSHTIEIEGTFEHGSFILEYAPLGIIISVNDRTKLEEKFNSELRRLYSQYVENNDQSFANFFEDLLKQ